MSELHAALGLVQLERLDEFIRKRALVAETVYVIQLDHHIDRNRVMKHLLDSGIGCRPYFTPIHSLFTEKCSATNPAISQ
ncbi:DegT/DnrJ/EryC1/StrS family aminotransferase [Thermoanaerobacterium sp. DL9XJH110]|uniref:DegT/DnrJ/EryC1/StrS family aminotransferase n=1 Tax=Thermoanaerobacterium sp. DL9XJH110 TaxID=3386643 RepID=UPI003BB48C06